jgi:hypothetical protein
VYSYSCSDHSITFPSEELIPEFHIVELGENDMIKPVHSRSNSIFMNLL